MHYTIKNGAVLYVTDIGGLHQMFFKCPVE